MFWRVSIFVQFASVTPSIYIPFNHPHQAIADFFKWDAAEIERIYVDSVEECAIMCSLRGRCPCFHFKDRNNKRCHMIIIREGLPMPDNIETDIKRFNRFDLAAKHDDESICAATTDSSKGVIKVDAAFYQPKGERFMIFSDSLMFGLKDLSSQGEEPDLCVLWKEHHSYRLKDLKNKVKNAFTVPSADGGYIIHVVDVDGGHNQYREFPSWPRFQASNEYKQTLLIAKYHVSYTLPADPATEAMATAEEFLEESRALEVFPCGILGSLPLYASHGSWTVPNDVTACAYRIKDDGSTEVYYVMVTGSDVLFYKTPYTGTDNVTTEVMPTAGYHGLVYFNRTSVVFQQRDFTADKQPQTLYGHFLHVHP